MIEKFKNYQLKHFSFLPSVYSFLKKNKTLFIILLFFITGFFMHSLIAEDVSNENEIALMEAIEKRVETKLSTMENEKFRQDTIMMVGDDIERLSNNIPEMSNDLLVSLRTIAMTYVDPITEATVKASDEKKSIENQTEEILLSIDESEADRRQQISFDALNKIEAVMRTRDGNIKKITDKRDQEMLAAVPSEMKEKFKIFINPDSADASVQTGN